MRDGIASQLPPSAPLTAVTGSSWQRGQYPTPTATDYGSSQNEGQVEHKRPTAGTPSLSTWARSQNWATPLASESKRGIRRMPPRERAGQELASQALSMWPTPTANDVKRPGQMMRGNESLPSAASSSWPTPIARDARGPSSGKNAQGSEPLAQTAIRSWPTPTAGDAKSSGSRASRGNPGNEANEGTSLTDATCRSGPPRLTTCTHGGQCKPKLNPRFVEWLLGWPIGWVRLEPLATDRFRQWLSWHGNA